MKAISTAWKQALTDDEIAVEYRAQLLAAMAENGIRSQRQIHRGLQKARREGTAFLPTVGQFAEWCLGDYADHGLPDPEQAYHDAAHGRWGAHVIVFLAAEKIGVFEVKRRTEKQMKSRYIDEYEHYAKRVMAGEQFSDVIEKRNRQLEQQRPKLEQKPVTKQEAAASRLECLAMLGLPAVGE